MMLTWNEIRAWRRTMRAELLAQRLVIPRSERQFAGLVVRDLVRELFPQLRHDRVGFTWPFKGEIDVRPLMRDLLTLGTKAALPVVVERGQPLEFWSWRPEMKLRPGIWNIPVPSERNPIRPTALLVPLLGFDAAGYRLGLGGGYYDRTLATMDPKPLTIGIGYEGGRLETVYPQPHDIPLDAIVTEAGFARFRHRGEPLAPDRPACDAATREATDEPGTTRKPSRPTPGFRDPCHAEGAVYASPPCLAHELDPAYLGYLGAAEIIPLLNDLLEAERAGARGVRKMSTQAAAATTRDALQHIARDEARFCAMLSRHISRLGGAPSSATGAFYEKLLAEETPAARLGLLNRGQGWVARKLRKALPRIQDSALHADLSDMLEVHLRNIERCESLAG